MNWPDRNASDYGSISNPRNLRCPRDVDGKQLVPVGFAARSSCVTLSDFRVSLLLHALDPAHENSFIQGLNICKVL